MELNRARWIFAALMLMVPVYFLSVPPIAQDETYHLFADGRTIWGIANLWNVILNLPFAAVGLLGLWKLHSASDRVLFSGVLLTFFGSAYYHPAPSDSRLVWDRLPMTLVFMALLACVISGEKDSRFSRWLILVPALWLVRDARYLTAALAFYGLAKLAEFYDRTIYSGFPINGHSIKHILAAIATFFIYYWRRRAAFQTEALRVVPERAEAAVS